MANSFEIISRKKVTPEIEDFINKYKEKRGVYKLEINDENIILIAAGEKPNVGHKIKLVKYEVDDEKTKVYIEEIAPHPNSVQIQVIHYPYIIAKVIGDVEFYDIRTKEKFL